MAAARSGAEGEEAVGDGLTAVVGTNLRRLRVQRGLSLERLSKQCGVSRGMLGQIELGQSAPTINVLWKIARALDVSFSTLISSRASGTTRVLAKTASKTLSSHDGSFTSRALFPFEGPRSVEFYELTLAPGGLEDAEGHAPGTMENIVVTRGSLEVGFGREKHILATGDAIQFEADVPHSYRNPGNEPGVYYLVMTYAEKVT